MRERSSTAPFIHDVSTNREIEYGLLDTGKVRLDIRLQLADLQTSESTKSTMSAIHVSYTSSYTSRRMFGREESSLPVGESVPRIARRAARIARFWPAASRSACRAEKNTLMDAGMRRVLRTSISLVRSFCRVSNLARTSCTSGFAPAAHRSR